MMDTEGTVADTTRNVLSRLRDARERANYWTAKCPSHDDHNPSLTVREHEDGVSVKCHAGCSTEDIVRAIGLEKRDLYPRASLKPRTSPSLGISEYYYYRDEEGNPLFRVRRTFSKRFIQQRYDKGTGEWVNGLGSVRPVPYRLPELLEADPAEPVFVVEGEKDVDRLVSEGLVATTSPMGARKWREEYGRWFEGRAVYVIPDNDETGEEHARQVARMAGATILRLPGLPDKGDASDWLDSGHMATELVALTKDVTPKQNGHRRSGLSTFTLSELVGKEFPPIKWIVPGVLPEGTMLLAGKPKMGKSWMALGLCVSVATGRPALGRFEVEAGDALYLALEDNERRLKDRSMKVLGGTRPTDRLHMTTAAGRLDSGLVGELEGWLEEHPEARLIVVDTVARVRARGSDKRSLYEQDYEVGADLTALAGRFNVAIVLVHHLKKGEADDPMDLVSGSTGLTAGVDGCMVLNRTRSAADAVLKAVHRELEDDPEMALRWDSSRGAWTYLGDAGEYRMSKERREIFDLLGENDEPLQPKEVAADLGKNPANVRQLMVKMIDEGLLDRAGYGKYVIAKEAERPAVLSVGGTGHTGHSDHASTTGSGVTAVTGVTDGEGMEEGGFLWVG